MDLHQEGPFKKTSYRKSGVEYFCEIKQSGSSSSASVFDSSGKLIAKKRIHIPEGFSISVIEDFVLAYNLKEIIIFKISDTKARTLKAQNNLFRNVQHLQLGSSDKKKTILFMADEYNCIYKIETTESSAVVSSIFDCKQQGLFGTISKLGCNKKGDRLILFFEESHRIMNIEFDWQRKDRLVGMTEEKNIINVYFKDQWKVVIKDCEKNEEDTKDLLSVYICHSGGGEWKKTLEASSFDIPLVIRAWNGNLLVVDQNSSSTILIWDHEMFHSCIDEFPFSGNLYKYSASLMFSVAQTIYNTLTVRLMYQAGISGQFSCSNIEMEKFTNSQNEIDYIHNNIQLIFDGATLNNHYHHQVSSFCGTDRQDLINFDLPIQLLTKLLEQHPRTCLKLSTALFHKTSFPLQDHTALQETTIGLYSHIEFILKRIQTQIRGIVYQLSDSPHQTQQILTGQSLQNIFELLSNMAQFLKSIGENVKAQDLRQPELGYSEIYQQCVILQQRAQSMFLAVNLLQVDRQVYDQKVEPVQREIRSSIILSKEEPQSQFHFTNFHELIFKSLEHNLNANDLGEKYGWKKIKEKITFWQIVLMLSASQNIYHSTYLYLLRKSEQDIWTGGSFISDPEARYLVKSLADEFMSRESGTNEFTERQLRAKLPQLTAKALTLNQFEILQYLCFLSVRTREYHSCLTILHTGAINSRNKSYQFQSETDRIQNSKFILKCYVLCDRMIDGREYLKGYWGDKRQMSEYFVETCIENKKTNYLFESWDEERSPQYSSVVQEETSKSFGKDNVCEIVNLLREIS